MTEMAQKYSNAYNMSAKCLSEDQLQMFVFVIFKVQIFRHGTEFEKYLQRYLFPCVAIFGILGNMLNLTVLLNRRMRSRSNTFLATLAIADICFLTFLLPNILANYPFFAFNYYFRYIYLHFQAHLLSLANWSSAVAIWCVIAVCADRLYGIRNPLYVRAHFGQFKMGFIIFLIVFTPGIFTIYQHFAYKCLVRAYCGGTQLISRCLPVNQDRWFGNQTNPYSISFRKFIDWSIMLNIALIVICPIVILTLLNILLFCALRQRTNKLLMGDELNSSNCGSTKPCIDNLKHHKTEQRVSLTVALIVTMFTVTNGPSAVNILLQKVYQSNWYDITLMCNTLVIFGKALNFILFCLSSKHFRNRLFNLAQKKVHEKLESRRRSSTTGHASVGQASRKNTPAPKYSTVQRSEFSAQF